MGDKPGEGQEPRDGDQGSPGQTDGNPSGAEGKPQGGEPETFSAEYVRKLREENAQHRTRAKSAEDELKKFKDAQLSDEEKRAQRLEELEAKDRQHGATMRASAIRYRVVIEAAKLGVRDPEDAYKLLNIEAIEFDEDRGEPKAESVKKSLEALVKAKPYLKGEQGGEGGTSSGNHPRQGDRTETPEQKRARLFGGASNFFDAASARRAGGGVRFDPDKNSRQRLPDLEGRE